MTPNSTGCNLSHALLHWCGLCGSVTYLIHEVSPPPGYVPCLGGMHCPDLPPGARVMVNADGTVSAFTEMPYANGKIVVFPTDRASFTATRQDPILFYNNKKSKKHSGK